MAIIYRLTWILSRHLPGTRVHHDAIRPLILCEFGLERLGNLVVPLFGLFAGLAVDFACRADGKLEANGVVKILADEYLRIDLLELDILIVLDSLS